VTPTNTFLVNRRVVDALLDTKPGTTEGQEIWRGVPVYILLTSGGFFAYMFWKSRCTSKGNKSLKLFLPDFSSF
jgi:hypothetical protein